MKVSDKETQKIINELFEELDKLCATVVKGEVQSIETLAKIRLIADELLRWMLL